MLLLLKHGYIQKLVVADSSSDVCIRAPCLPSLSSLSCLSIAFCLFWNPCYTQDTENTPSPQQSEEKEEKEKRGRKKRDKTPKDNKDSKKSKKEDIILIKDPYTMDDLNKLKSNFNSGLSKARDTLIEIYKDKNQILLVRLEA